MIRIGRTVRGVSLLIASAWVSAVIAWIFDVSVIGGVAVSSIIAFLAGIVFWSGVSA